MNGKILCEYLHTGCCILSRTAAIPHMVRLGDAPVHYLHVILLTWNILTRTTEAVSINKLRKMCDVIGIKEYKKSLTQEVRQKSDILDRRSKG